MMATTTARYDLSPGPLPIRMAHSDATAAALVKCGSFGADLIRFPAGGSVPEHTHAGAHILFVLSGEGWLDHDGNRTRLTAGLCYLVPPMVRHAIKAGAELTLISVANDHRDAGAEDRLHVVA